MKKIALSLTVALLLGCSSLVAKGSADAAKSSAEVGKSAVTTAKSDARSAKATSIKEAIKAVALTRKVLVDLAKKDTKSAIKDLEDAIGKLEVVLASEKAPKLLPIDSSVSAIEFAGGPKEIKETIKQVEDLLDDGKVQDARVLLDTLQSQINVITVSLPLASYPDALKLAAKYLHDNKVDEARVVLETALSTLVEDVAIVPIPIVKAQALIKVAKEVAKSDKDQALKHLAAAKEELKRAKLLGYVSKSDVTYKALDDAIDAVTKEVKGKNRAEKLFDDLIAKLKSFKEKIVNSDDKEKK